SRIAFTLSLELVRVEAARSASDPDALDYILRGRAAMTQPRSRDRYTTAIDLFEHALVLDPRSAEAQSRLAAVLAGRVMDYMADTNNADITRAEDLAAQALTRAPDSDLAHHAKGQVLRAQRRFAEAIPEYEMVLASNRNLAFPLFALGQCKLFTGAIGEVIP